MRQGRAVSDDLLLLRSAPNQLGASRFGYAISKQVGNAVTRNLVRRRLRAALERLPVKSGWDVVISARKASATVSFQALTASLRKLIQRSGLLNAPEGLEEGKA